MKKYNSDTILIIDLPFAGGNRYNCVEIKKHIPKPFKWITLELPGRGDRFKEDLLDSVDNMVNDLYFQLLPLITNRSYIIYGHSMGTLLGYELTKRIVQNRITPPQLLFFTGRGGPGYESKYPGKKSLLPKDEFWKEIQAMGGLPDAVLANNELLELYYPILKSDCRAIEDYEYRSMVQPFSIPIHICMGSEEIGEGKYKTPLMGFKDWKKETSSTCTFEIYPGDHFFINNNSCAIAQKIQTHCLEDNISAM